MKKTYSIVFLRLFLSALVCFAAFRYSSRKWDPERPPEVYEVSVTDKRLSGAPEGSLTLKLTGIGLYRVNTLRADGKPVRVLHHESQGYSECYLCVPADTFQSGKTYRLQAGKRYPFPIGELYRSGSFLFAAD